MKIFLMLPLTILLTVTCYAQTSPPTQIVSDGSVSNTNFVPQTNYINFSSYPTDTVITTQYLSEGVVFSGYNGSDPPRVYDYGSNSYGRILHSATWYDALRVNFVNPLNPNEYQLASKIEFDNAVNSATEIDYMNIDVYDSVGVLLRHYMSTSFEHVVIDLGIPSAAYMTVDDVNATAFIFDNLLVTFENLAVRQTAVPEFTVFPNPFTDALRITTPLNEETEVAIYSMTSGKLLTQFFNQSTTINTSGLAAGMYLYTLKNKNGSVSTGKLVKY